MYAVGVGSGANRTELQEIASGSEYVYTSASFKELQNIAPGIRKRLCEGEVYIETFIALTSVLEIVRWKDVFNVDDLQSGAVPTELCSQHIGSRSKSEFIIMLPVG